MTEKSVLAIDFGTANTYLTKCPIDQSTPVGVDFGEGRDGLATAILYRNSKQAIIGDKALEEFGDADESERQDYTIRTQFKPDITDSEEARQYSRDFLKGILTEAAKAHIEMDPANKQVIFGAPSESNEEYRKALSDVASQSGFGKIKIIDEPKGAIYFHVQRKDITPEEALKGTLVIDFGGGTCDFAIVVKGEVQHSWGDMHLGGRLFDDIFYQWLIEQNPDAAEDMKAEQAEFFVLWFRCRQVKEKFSQSMTMDKTAKFRKAVGEYGRISDVTWDGFIQRAQNYRPSETYKKYMHEVNPNALARFNLNETVDLLQWFRQSLREGLQHARIDASQITCILLTGGSSSWSFVPEIVMQEMAAVNSRPRLIRSDRPYATISEGLAIIPSLQQRFNIIQNALREEKPAFISEKIYPLIERRMEEAAQRIADAVATSLFDQRIRPVFQDFSQKGGSVASLKQRIAQQAAIFEPQIKSIVEQEVSQVLSGLPAAVVELMTQWFKDHDLVVEHQLNREDLDSIVDSGVSLKDIDIYGDIEAIIGTISVGIIATLVASISGGGGTALIATGPFGLIIGAIIGVAVGALVISVGLDEAKRRAENWDGVPLWLIRQALSEKKVNGVRDDLRRQVREKTIEHTDKAKQQLEQQITIRVEEEIKNLSVINQL